jgi:hypothetical protein
MNLDEHADLILHGGKLTTLDPANPSATALADYPRCLTSRKCAARGRNDQWRHRYTRTGRRSASVGISSCTTRWRWALTAR